MSDIIKAKQYNNHPSGIEAKEIIRMLPFQLANIYKYVIRRNDKGSHKKDLEKALEYIEWEKEEPSVRLFVDIALDRDKLLSVLNAETNKDAKEFYDSFYDYLIMKYEFNLARMQKSILKLIENNE